MTRKISHKGAERLRLFYEWLLDWSVSWHRIEAYRTKQFLSRYSNVTDSRKSNQAGVVSIIECRSYAELPCRLSLWPFSDLSELSANEEEMQKFASLKPGSSRERWHCPERCSCVILWTIYTVIANVSLLFTYWMFFIGVKHSYICVLHFYD